MYRKRTSEYISLNSPCQPIQRRQKATYSVQQRHRPPGATSVWPGRGHSSVSFRPAGQCWVHSRHPNLRTLRVCANRRSSAVSLNAKHETVGVPVSQTVQSSKKMSEQHNTVYRSAYLTLVVIGNSDGNPCRARSSQLERVDSSQVGRRNLSPLGVDRFQWVRGPAQHHGILAHGCGGYNMWKNKRLDTC